MGIKNLWKKIPCIVKAIAVILGILVALINIIKEWDVLFSIPSFLKNLISEILKSSIRITVWHVLIFILVICALIWLIRRFKKSRNVSHFNRIAKRKDWQIDWNSKHEFILEKLAEKTRSYNSLYKFYEKEFSDTSKLKFNVIIEDLEEAELIRFSYKIFKKKYYEATRKGRDCASKGLLEEMEMKKLASRY